jgi:hypothetical protein
MPSKTLTLVNALTHEDRTARSKAAEKLDSMLARGADFSEAVSALSARFWELNVRIQPTVLSILAKTMGQADFASLVEDVV